MSKCELEGCGEHHQVCPLKEPNVLNAKQHEREAHIIAQAGEYGAVTIATNMAGRGTDIILGGNPEVIAEGIARKQNKDLIALPEDEAAKIRAERGRPGRWSTTASLTAGGLHIIGTERHEARRIDNQLRGRAGRQGDPGSSRFFVSFGDDVMRRFAPEWIGGLLGRMGMDENTPLESGMVSKAIEQAQTKVEGHNFDIRKHVVQYDDVMNRHRDLVYTERRKILEGADLRSNLLEMVDQEIERAFDAFAPGDRIEDWDVASLITELKTIVAAAELVHGAARQSVRPRNADRRSHRARAQAVRREGAEPRRGQDADARAHRPAWYDRPAVGLPPDRAR